MSLRYLIDGYNLLYALPQMPVGSWEQKRLALLQHLTRDSPQGANAATVIFDSREGSGNRTHHGALEVVYTAGETADDWIIRRVREIGQPRNVVVVTDDLGIRHMIRGTGAKWMSAKEFLAHAVKRTQSPAPQPTDLDDITDELRKEWGL